MLQILRKLIETHCINLLSLTAFLNFRCWSYMGRKGGKQTLSLKPPDDKKCHCLCDVGRTLHEMMHALGFYHEHSRTDRDNYIKIVEENVKKGNFIQ